LKLPEKWIAGTLKARWSYLDAGPTLQTEGLEGLTSASRTAVLRAVLDGNYPTFLILRLT